MSFLAWILFGLIAGLFSAALEDNLTTGKIISAILLGVLGAVMGGLLSSVIFSTDIEQFNFISFFIAVGASTILLLASRYFRRAG